MTAPDAAAVAGLVDGLRSIGSARAVELAARMEGLPLDGAVWLEVLDTAYGAAMAEHEEALERAEAALVVSRRALAEQGAQLERAESCLSVAQLLWHGASDD